MLFGIQIKLPVMCVSTVLALPTQRWPLEDENALTILDQNSEEFRFKTLALSPLDDIILVVHVEEDEDTIRIISAREAEAREREQYYSGDYNG